MSRQSRLGCCWCGVILAAGLLVAGQGCAPTGDPGNGNGNSSGSNMNEGGTGNTIDDLPDLSADDDYGSGEGADAAAPGLLLIGFDQTLTEASFLQRADAAASTLNGELIDTVSDIRLATVAVDPLGESDALALATSLGSVDFAESNAGGRLAEVTDLLPQANSAPYAQYQLFVTDAIRARGISLSSAGNTTVAVLDSGCDLGHVEFDGSLVIAGANYLTGATNAADVSDAVVGGHGTGVVSLLAAQPESEQLAGLLRGQTTTVYKVADGNGQVTLDAAVKGIIGALNGDADGNLQTTEVAPADVICASFSFQGDYASLSRAVFHATDRGAVVVAAAGNNGRSADGSVARYPAGYSTVIAVGATDIADRAVPFTNRSPVLQVAAPGVDLLVAAPGNTYRFVDGTSFAAAQVAGASALALSSNPALTATQLRERLNARGDALPAGGGFGSIPITRLNINATLLDESMPPEPYIIPDGQLVSVTGVSTQTLATRQAGASQSTVTPEAFADESLYWYGYFPGDDVSFELIDGQQQLELPPTSLTSSTIDLFLEFLRGIDVGQPATTFGVLQQAVLTMPDLSGERRVVGIVALAGGVASEPRQVLFNPLRQGFNIIGYKNFDSAVWHLREEEGGAFDPNLADLQLLGAGSQPEINWDSTNAVDRVQLGSSLDPDFFVTTENPDGQTVLMPPPVRIGECVGADVPQQVCGEEIGLPENDIARILVRAPLSGAARFAALEVIYVP